MRYVVVLEKGETGFGAWVPDLPGCVAAGADRDETVALIKEAIELHIDELKAHGEAVPPPVSCAELIDISVA